MTKRPENFRTGVPPCRGADRHHDGDMSEQITLQNNETILPLTTKRYYRVDEVAYYFAISERTVYRMIYAGEIKAIRIRDRIRISVEEIRALEERGLLDEF